MSRAGSRKILGDSVKIVAVTLLLFIGIELVLRGAYFARNAVVDYVVLPYNAAQDFGPIPPWIDHPVCRSPSVASRALTGCLAKRFLA